MARKWILLLVWIWSITIMNSSFIKHRPQNGTGRILISKHKHHDDYNSKRLMVIFSTNCQGIHDENDNENVINILNTKMDILESMIVDNHKCLTRHGINKYYKHSDRNKRISFLNINKQNLNCIHSESIQFDYDQHCVDMFAYEPIFRLNSNYKIYENSSEYQCISENTASSRFSSTFPWGLNSISHGISYNSTKGNYSYPNTSIDNGVDLIIIDSGVLSNHVEFYDDQVVHMMGDGPAMFKPYENNTYLTWYVDHGTHVSGIAAGINYGASKGLKIYDYRVCVFPAEANNYNDHPCYTSLFFDAFDGIINQLTNSKGRRVVINISIGGGRSIFQIYEYYFNMITSLGGIVVISAGNDNHDSCLNQPAFLRSAITVGAYNISRQKADFSNYGKCVDIWAPGVNIWSSVVACPGCDACGTCIGHKDGTSMATPFITGMVANILYVNPTLTFAQIKSILNQNRVKIIGEQCNSNEIPCYGAMYGCTDTYNNVSDYIETNVNITNQITPTDEYNLNTQLSNSYNCSAMIAYEYDAEGKYSSMSSYGINQCYSQRDYQGATAYSYKYQCNYTNNSVNLIAYENSTDCSSISEAQIINTFYNGQFDGIFKYFIHCNPESNDSICNIKRRTYFTLSEDDCSLDIYNRAKYDDYMYVKGVCYDSKVEGKSYSFTCINNIIYADVYYNGNDSDSLVTTCNPDHFEYRGIFLQQNECKYDSKENLYNDDIIDCGLNDPIYPMHEYNFDNEYSNVYNCSAMVRFKYNKNGDYDSMLINAADQCSSSRSYTNGSPYSYMYRCNFTDNTVDYLSYYDDANCSSTPTVRTINNGEFDGTYKYFINCNPNADNIMCNIKIRKYETSTYDDCLYNNAGAIYHDSIYIKGLCWDDGTKGRSYTVSCVNDTVYVDRYFNGDDSDILVTTCNPNNWILRSAVFEPNNKCVYNDGARMYDKYMMIDCGTTVPFTFDPTPRPTFSPTPPPTEPNDEYNFIDNYSNIYNCSALVEYQYDGTGNFSKMLTYAVDQCYSYRLSQNVMAYSEVYRCNFGDNSIDVLYYANNDNCSSTPQLIRSIQNKEFIDNKKYFVNCNSNADDNKCVIKIRHYRTLTNNDCMYNHTGAKYFDTMYQKGLCYDTSVNGKSYQLACVNNTVYMDYYYDDNTSDTLITSCNPDNFEERKVYQESNKCTFVDTENLWDDAVIECGEDFPFTFKPTLKPTMYPDEEYNLNEKYTNLYNCSVMMYLKYVSGEYNATYSRAVDQCYSVSSSENENAYSYMNRCNFANNSIDILHYTNNTNCSSTPQIRRTIKDGEYDGTYKFIVNCNPNANDDFCNIKIRKYETATNYDCLYDHIGAKHTDLMFQKGLCYHLNDVGSYSYKCIDNVLYVDYFLSQTKNSFITTCDPLNWLHTELVYQENNCKYNKDTSLYDSYVIDCGYTLNPTMEPTINPTASPSSSTTASPTTTTAISTKNPTATGYTYSPSSTPSHGPTPEGYTYEPTVAPSIMISPTNSNGAGGDNGENAKTGLDAVPSFVWLVLVVVFALLFVLFLLLWSKKKKDVNSITDEMFNPNVGTPYVQLTDDADDQKL